MCRLIFKWGDSSKDKFQYFIDLSKGNLIENLMDFFDKNSLNTSALLYVSLIYKLEPRNFNHSLINVIVCSRRCNYF